MLKRTHPPASRPLIHAAAGLPHATAPRFVLAVTLALAFGIPAAAQEPEPADETEPTDRTASADEPASGDGIELAGRVRSILSDKCYTCHGPDEANRRGGLRLDRYESALEGGDSGAEAIVPGDVELSELARRVLSDDPSEQMPPPHEEKQLSDSDRETLVRWIEKGAPWEELWSLVPPRRPELPPVSDPARVTNEIDRFVLARLERKGLAPSPPADPATILRRVTLDLTGLPPTVDEMEAFVADPSEDAYQAVVDRLLASPRFGEHRARYWLDAARYGDTHGLHLDNYREMWPYRDWVVDAFNRNLPFDRFVTEQIAGDLLPDANTDQRIATGFNRCHVTTNEGGSIAEEVRIRNVIDRTVTFGTVFLGMTLDCTRCHDHKYDPLTMEDFYSLSAFFNNIDSNPMDGNRKDHAPVIRAPNDRQRQQLAELDGQIEETRQRLDGEWPEIDRAQVAWEESVAESILVASPNSDATDDGAEGDDGADGDSEADGESADGSELTATMELTTNRSRSPRGSAYGTTSAPSQITFAIWFVARTVPKANRSTWNRPSTPGSRSCPGRPGPIGSTAGPTRIFPVTSWRTFCIARSRRPKRARSRSRSAATTASKSISTARRFSTATSNAVSNRIKKRSRSTSTKATTSWSSKS